MFALSNKTEYALRAILDLCYHSQSQETVPLTEISARRNVPLKYLAQIMLTLKKAGLVESRRGIGGGFSLAKSPREITLGEVMRSVEGATERPFAARIAQQEAAQQDQQAFVEVWVNVTQSMSAIIDSVTLADIMRRANELRSHKNEFNFII
jgi:Rrf2 family transcriptional regulator, cysteine metabolism repressor